jgi:hypothetical protein
MITYELSESQIGKVQTGRYYKDEVEYIFAKAPLVLEYGFLKNSGLSGKGGVNDSNSGL